MVTGKKHLYSRCWSFGFPSRNFTYSRVLPAEVFALGAVLTGQFPGRRQWTGAFIGLIGRSVIHRLPAGHRLPLLEKKFVGGADFLCPVSQIGQQLFLKDVVSGALCLLAHVPVIVHLAFPAANLPHVPERVRPKKPGTVAGVWGLYRLTRAQAQAFAGAVRRAGDGPSCGLYACHHPIDPALGFSQLCDESVYGPFPWLRLHEPEHFGGEFCSAAGAVGLWHSGILPLVLWRG
ncbi:hypothetical protein [Deinococcus sp. Marseille-Q6407]|uniref:hypothetical protein n=1 Tax=Deinococcus sp. Marseille-Q6407 TaxID=2969223 RepID=UPI0021C05FB0|nr:hypothetical protein [Deinococcus sp. Marseille-Q6407]